MIPDIRIVIFSNSDGTSGAPHQCMGGIWLASKGYDIQLIRPGEPEKNVLESPLGRIESVVVPHQSAGLGWHARYLAQCLKVRWRSPEGTIFYVLGSVACPAAWLALQGVPRNRVIYHTQDFLEPGRHPHWEFFEKRMVRRAGWVICNEANRARFMKSYYRLPEMPTVVRTALPRDWPIPERDQDLRKKLIRQLNCKPVNCRLIAVGGSYSPVRCTDQLLAAMDFLPASYNLVFTGMKEKSPDAPGMKAIREHGLTDRVILLDHLPFQDLLRYYAACDVGMLLYPNDGIGNYYQAPGRLSEYIATGLPFVASDFPNFRLLSLQHDLGVVCDPEFPESIADAIRQICERPQHKRQEERERLRKLARTEFAYESQAGRIEEIIRQAQEAIK